MRRLCATVAALALALPAPGCGGGSVEDAIIKDINDLNNETAEAVARAPDLSAVKGALQAQQEKQQAVIKKIQAVPAERRKEVLREIDRKVKASEDRLEKALDAMHARLKEGPNPVVLLETSEGPIQVELYEKLAPVTVKNFLTYVDEKHYDGTIFHRVIPDFMIQGGGFEPGLKRRNTHPPIPNESYNGLSNTRGTLTMARTPEPDSASDQFFINVKDNLFLDRNRADDQVGYAVFGRVVEGMDTVDKIRKVPTHAVGGNKDVPVEDVLIKSARRVTK